jgi:tetratricopeptide (TPR) repeat protein
VAKRVGTDSEAVEYGKRLERLLRSRKPGRDDRVVREEMLALILQIDDEFESPGVIQVVAAEKLARSFVRTKCFNDACRVEGDAVAAMRALGRTNETLYFERLTSYAEKLIRVGRNDDAERLFREEVPRTKSWPSSNKHEVFRFLHAQTMLYDALGRVQDAVVAYERVAELGIEAFGENHQQYYPIMRSYSLALLRSGRPHEAAKKLEAAIAHSVRIGSMNEEMATYARQEVDEIRSIR